MPFDPTTAAPIDAAPKKFDPTTAMDAMADPRNDPEQQMREREAAQVRIGARRAREKFVNENVQPGVPMDVDSGISAATRARLSFEDDIDKQAQILTQNGHQVRKSRDGANLIVREGGKEVLLRPMNSTLSGGDVAGATFPLIKAGATTAAAVLSGGASLPVQAAIIGGTAGMTDAGSRLISRGVAGQDAGGIAQSAREEATINAALPLAGAAVGAGARKVGDVVRGKILSNVGPTERAATAAAGRLGTDLPVGAATGSPAVAKAGMLNLEEELARQNSLRGIHEAKVGPGVLSEKDVADRVKPVFSDAEQLATRAAEADMGHAERAGQSQIQAQLDSGLVPTTLKNSEIGGHLRGKFDAFLQKVKTEAEKNYPVFHQKAAEEGIVLDKAPISDLVADLKAGDPHGVTELLSPSVRRVKAVEKKLTQPLRQVDPSTGEAVELPSPDLTFEEAIHDRAILRKLVDSPEGPLGDVNTAPYKRLIAAYTEAIDGGLQRGSPELRSLYDTARGAYAQGADALDRGIVQRLFRDPGQAGFNPDENVVRQLFTGRGQLTALRDMKNILDPQDYKLLLRGGLNEMIGAESAGRQTVDAKGFLNRLNGLDAEVRAELLGSAEQGLRRNLSVMNRAQGVQIPKEELEDAILGGGRAGQLLEQAIRRAEANQQNFNSSVMAKLRKGVLDEKTANEDGFTRWLMGPQVSAADAKQAFTQIGAASPANLGVLRQRTLANVLEDVGAKAPLGSAGERVVFDSDSKALDKLLRAGSPERDKLTTALGPDGVQFLDDLADYAKSIDKMRVNEVVTPTEPGRLLLRAATGGALGAATGHYPLGAAGAAAGLGSDVLRAGARKAGGALVRTDAFDRWLATGELPSLGGKLGAAVKATVLSAPEIERAREALGGAAMVGKALQEQDLEEKP